MKIHVIFTISIIIILCLTGCQSVWRRPIPDSEIVYQGEEIRKSAAHMMGFVRPNGADNQVLEIDRAFEKPVWSSDGELLYGLYGGEGYYMGYPAYWDLQRGRIGFCNREIPYFTQIKGSGNPENPYEVIVQHVWIIIIMDLSNCKQVRTLVDFSNRPGDFSISGFSYSASRQELLYGLIVNNKEYRLMHRDLKTGEEVMLAEGINPSWSPDCNRVAFIGLDGLYVMEVEGVESEPRQLIDRPFFDPWRGGSPWSYVSVPSWSPDGTWLVYHRCSTAKICTWEDAYIYKIRSDGGQEEIIIKGGEYPSWHP